MINCGAVSYYILRNHLIFALNLMNKISSNQRFLRKKDGCENKNHSFSNKPYFKFLTHVFNIFKGKKNNLLTTQLFRLTFNKFIQVHRRLFTLKLRLTEHEYARSKKLAEKFLFGDVFVTNSVSIVILINWISIVMS